MKSINFLPDWYNESKRQQQHMRRQYVALAIIFIAMISYNLVSAQKISRTSAVLTRLETAKVEAENTAREFNAITTELNKVRVKADLIERIDSRINVAAVLAEMSHIIGETVVLSQLEFVAEPFVDDDKSQRAAGAGVRVAGSGKETSPEVVLGNVRFRILLSGVAASPEDVAALICRLDGSTYFRQVSASFWRSGKVQTSTRDTRNAGGSTAETGRSQQAGGLDVTEFGITCYLANYKEGDAR